MTLIRGVVAGFSAGTGATDFGVVQTVSVGNSAPIGQFKARDPRDSQTKITSAYRVTSKRVAIKRWSWNVKAARPGQVRITKFGSN